MATTKVLGTETEYGLMMGGAPDYSPAILSALTVNAYPGPKATVQWSYEEEAPTRDARAVFDSLVPVSEGEASMVNAVLSNGARLYVDHSHPEYSGPECFDPLEGALYDKAGEGVMREAITASAEVLPANQELRLFKNNSDGKGNSYGAHENYLMSRSTPFSEIVRFAPTFFITRQIFTGSGKVGAENGRPSVDYQITQRADFFEELVGIETTIKRPIVNTRDEPHGDPEKYRRLHVIIGDANRSEVQIFLKLGVTAIFLAALEDGALPDPIILANPVRACWETSHSPFSPVGVDDGGFMTPLEIQFRYLEWLSKYVENESDDEVWQRVLAEWRSVLEDLESDPSKCADRLDWAAKQELLNAYRERHGLDWTSHKLAALALLYHEISPRRDLYGRLVAEGRIRRLFTDESIASAVREPPKKTRAFFRGKCVDRFSDDIWAANWDSLVFDTGEPHLCRIPMMEPLRGDAERVAGLFAEASNVSELIENLGK